MKQPIFCAVSRSAARLLLIHVFVLNKGREPFNDIITGSTNGLPAVRIEQCRPTWPEKSDSRRPSQWAGG